MHPIFTQQLLDSNSGLRYSVNRIPGDGSTTVHSFSFSGGYISKTHIKAYVGDASDTEGTSFVERTLLPEHFVGDYQLTVSPALAADKVLYIIRDTPKDTSLVEATGTTKLDAQTLMTLAQQAVFNAAEVTDRVSELIIDLANASVTLPDIGVVGASETVAGIARVGTTAEVFGVTADNLIVTPKKLWQVLDALPESPLPVQIQHDGANLGSDATTLNFADGLEATRSGSIITIKAEAAAPAPAPPPSQTPLAVQDDGTEIIAAGSLAALNFTGSGVSITGGPGSSAVVNIPGVAAGSQSAITVQDEGTPTGAAGPTTVNFTGAGVTASQSGSTVTVNVPATGAATTTTAVTHAQAGTGGATVTVASLLAQGMIPVTNFTGVDQTGVADSTAGINAAIAYCLSIGHKLYFPAGTYKCTSSLIVDMTANTADFGGRFSMEGAGPGSTRLVKFATGNYELIQVLGGTSAGVSGHFTINNLYLQGTDVTGIGLGVRTLAFFSVSNVVAIGFDYGVYGVDILSCLWTMLVSRFNNHGFRFERSSFSYPNAITMNACVIGNNYNYGGWVVGGAGLNVVGGSVESNGIGGSGTKGGLFITSSGHEGGVGINANGVHFENNVGVADVWCANAVQSVAHQFTGCTFIRLDSTNFVTNNVLVETSGVTQVANFSGCGFKSFGSYTPSSSRKYIDVLGTTNSISWVGCYMEDAAELPTVPNAAGGGGGSGVSSFNTRTGAVSLTSGDVTGALGFTPQAAGSYQPYSSQIMKLVDGNGIGSGTATATLSGAPVGGASKWIRLSSDSYPAGIWFVGWY